MADQCLIADKIWVEMKKFLTTTKKHTHKKSISNIAHTYISVPVG